MKSLIVCLIVGFCVWLGVSYEITSKYTASQLSVIPNFQNVMYGVLVLFELIVFLGWYIVFKNPKKGEDLIIFFRKFNYFQIILGWEMFGFVLGVILLVLLNVNKEHVIILTLSGVFATFVIANMHFLTMKIVDLIRKNY